MSISEIRMHYAVSKRRHGWLRQILRNGSSVSYWHHTNGHYKQTVCSTQYSATSKCDAHIRMSSGNRSLRSFSSTLLPSTLPQWRGPRNERYHTIQKNAQLCPTRTTSRSFMGSPILIKISFWNVAYLTLPVASGSKTYGSKQVVSFPLNGGEQYPGLWTTTRQQLSFSFEPWMNPWV